MNVNITLLLVLFFCRDRGLAGGWWIACGYSSTVRAELANGVYDSSLIRLEQGSAVGRE